MSKPKTPRALDETEAQAILRNVRVSPRKLNLVAAHLAARGVEGAVAVDCNLGRDPGLLLQAVHVLRVDASHFAHLAQPAQELVREGGLVPVLWQDFLRELVEGQRVPLEEVQVEHVGRLEQVELVQLRVYSALRAEVRYTGGYRDPRST